MLVFIHANFKLDLTYLQVTFSEKNQWFKDDFSTEFSLPFDLYLDSDLSKNSGFQSHFNANQNQTKFNGYLDKDGELSAATLKFQSIKGNFISAVINSGFDNFPSYNKKLSKLPLEQKPVDDILTDAISVISKPYPATNYNFPMIHTDKYDPESEEWNEFGKIINNYDDGAFLENTLVEGSNLDIIKNIMQPLPYLIHVLKAGVADAGFVLEGDILDDASLVEALIFRDGEYYQRTLREEIPIKYLNEEWDSFAFQDNGFQYVTYTKEITIEKKGDYLLFGEMYNLVYSARKNPAWSHDRYRCSKLFVNISKVSGGSSTTLQSFFQDRQDDGQSNLWATVQHFSYDDQISFEAGDKLIISKTEPRRDYSPSVTPDYPEAISLKLIPIRYRNPDGSPIISFLNLNEIDLTKVVPDMTFKDLITIIKNWFNYEFITVGNSVFMNRIENKINRNTAVDLSKFDIEEPEIIFSDDREFELMFSDGKTDNTYKYDSILINKSGSVINDYTTKDTTNSIKIDALPLPVISRNGVTTAFSFTDETSKLRLVFMQPIIAGTKPVAIQNENVLIPKIAVNNFGKWLDFRINSNTWNWDFIISVEKFRELSTQSLIYAFKNYHVLTEIEKERLNQFWWRITAKTESLL